MTREEILKASLAKKQDRLNNMIQGHFDDVKAANGQPLNDKRNGAATFRRWNKQSGSISNQLAEVEKTKAALGREEWKNDNCQATLAVMPDFIKELVADGILKQWRKYPNMFFVDGIQRGRIIYDMKKGQILHRYYSEVPEADKLRFADVFNRIKAALQAA